MVTQDANTAWETLVEHANQEDAKIYTIANRTPNRIEYDERRGSVSLTSLHHAANGEPFYISREMFDSVWSALCMGETLSRPNEPGYKSLAALLEGQYRASGVMGMFDTVFDEVEAQTGPVRIRLGDEPVETENGTVQEFQIEDKPDRLDGDMNVSKSQLGEIAKQMVVDYENPRSDSSPFEMNDLPGPKVIREIQGTENKALFLTLTVSINYMKETDGDDGLWQNAWWLWNKWRSVFEPEKAAQELPDEDMADLFGELGWWGKKDWNIWKTICTTLYRDFDGSVLTLLESMDNDAVQLTEYMDSHGGDFPYLKGEKIRPLWLRLIHEEVRPLDNIEQIPLPVDTHIISITNTLLGTEFSQEEPADRETVRQIWTAVCRKNDIVPVRLDQPLWLTQKHWDDWGEGYIERLVRSVHTDGESTS